VQAALGDDVRTGAATVPDTCTAVHPTVEGRRMQVVGGSHEPVVGPDFVFDLGE
jgi:hypothetical protein